MLPSPLTDPDEPNSGIRFFGQPFRPPASGDSSAQTRPQMAECTLGSMAIRPCFVDTLSGFNAPSVFLKNDSIAPVPPFPSTGSARAAFPSVLSTMKALRLPVPNTGSLMDSLARPNSRLLGSLRCGWRPPQQPGPVQARYRWLVELVVHRISQVPGESIPCLCPALGSRPVRLASP